MLTTKELLTTQFEATYNEENWFKPLKDVLSDLTDEEFKWKENDDMHSIRQLVIHLLFWNERYYNRFKNTPMPPAGPFTDRDPTFDDNDLSKEELIKNFYNMMDGFIKEMKNAPEEKFEERVFTEPDRQDLWWESIHCINLHNAYHLGQMMVVKKQIRNK